MKLRMTMIVGALAALAMVGCSNGNRNGTGGSSQVNSDQQDLAQTEQNAQQHVNDARQQAQQNVNDAQQNLAQTEQDAQKNVDQAKQDAANKVNDQRQQLAQDETRNQGTEDDTGAAAKDDANRPDKLASQSGTVLGTLTDMDKDSFKVKDTAGNEVELKRNSDTQLNTQALRKGAEVRAAFRVDDHGDKWATSLTQIAQPWNNPLEKSRTGSDK
jgi:vacuolar-type H+-ATPase subunit H